MKKITQSTQSPKASDIDRSWHLFDAKDKILGRLATDLAKKLVGKERTNYSPHLDMGDYVVVINAKNVNVTGKKMEKKVYTRYSGYPGGLKEINLKMLMDKDARKVISNAVSGMLPKNKLRKARMSRLFVFNNEEHPYNAQLKSN